jgi:Rieske [2Fe-2S] domain
MTFVLVANLDDLEVGDTMLVDQLREPICLIRLDEDDVRAIHNTCTHQQQPLHELPRVFRTHEFAVILRGCLHFPALFHDLLRGPVSECGVETLPIIAELDVACDVFACFLSCRVDGAVDSLDFQRPVE